VRAEDNMHLVLVFVTVEQYSHAPAPNIKL